MTGYYVFKWVWVSWDFTPGFHWREWGTYRRPREWGKTMGWRGGRDWGPIKVRLSDEPMVGFHD